jgi:hypothetical protein
MSHPLQCRCGVVQGTVSRPEIANRMVCYCRDCQAFAHFLGRAADILDEDGGSDVVQTPPANVVFTAGVDSLACMRLTERGLLRWYASCCNTPIGNTPPDFRMSFVGLVSTCLQSPTRSIEDSFGPVRAGVHEVRQENGALELPRNAVGHHQRHGDDRPRAPQRGLQAHALLRRGLGYTHRYAEGSVATRARAALRGAMRQRHQVALESGLRRAGLLHELTRASARLCLSKLATSTPTRTLSTTRSREACSSAPWAVRCGLFRNSNLSLFSESIDCSRGR